MNEKINYKGYTISILNDDDCNPREYDNLGTIYAAQARYNPDGHSLNELLDYNDNHPLDTLSSTHIFQTIYIYEHSCISIIAADSNPFNDPWDSCVFGIIAVPKSKIYKEFGCKRISKKRRQLVLQILDGEIQDLNDACNGRCYGYQIENHEGDVLDSCFGFIGNESIDNDIIPECKNLIEYYIRNHQ